MGERPGTDLSYDPATGSAAGEHRSDTYDIGVVGVGHWATKFRDAINGDLSFTAATDVVPAENKENLLNDLGIEQYYNTDGELRDAFFDDVDVVQIASPITYHEEQTRRALEEDVLVVTEKAYGPEADAYERVRDHADAVGGTTYPHLHYLRKQPTIYLDDHIGELVEAYGPIQDVEATFIESYSTEDRERGHIFTPESGGIVMDWIHPVEVLVDACDATFDDVLQTDGYITDERLSADQPTAARTEYSVNGPLFDPDATATVRVGKGFPEGATRKAFRFTFPDAEIDVVYAGSGTERETDYRGQIQVNQEDASSLQKTERVLPRGPTPYELMAQDMVHAIETGEPPVDSGSLQEMYETVDMTNAVLEDSEPHRSDTAVDALLQEAWECTT